jgi:hypothetical protein
LIIVKEVRINPLQYIQWQTNVALCIFIPGIPIYKRIRWTHDRYTAFLCGNALYISWALEGSAL